MSNPYRQPFLSFLFLTVFAIAIGLGAAPVAAQEYQIAPAPSWVAPVALKASTPSATGAVADGIDYLLSDVQVRVGGETQARYLRIVRRAVNTGGVERISNISISFDPSYQRLTLHGVTVHRSGKTLNVLARSTIRVLQREIELESQIYDGSKTLNIIVPDVRVGDVVAYHFTSEGSNPVFAGSFQDFIELQWSVPIGQMQYRLLWPTGRKIYIRKHGIDLAAEIRVRGDLTEYRWARQDLPALSADSGRPDWYDPYPWIQISESPSWDEVAHWARDLFDPNGDEAKSPALRTAVSRITSAVTPEQRVLDILRYVQEDIRYLGIEIGGHSHAPSRPEEVMERRFGDCKDKTRLMVGLLHAAGIEAWPALVHTGVRRGIANYHPAKTIFNHVIVYTRVNGKFYWLDPTLKHQKGTLETLYQPNYEKALVVSKQTTALTDMNVAIQPHVKFTKETIDLRGPRGQPAAFTVTTSYERYYADSMRQSLGAASHDEIQKTYTNYYVRTYPGMRTAKPFEVVDDGRQNRLTMTEHYEVHDIWVNRADTKTESVVFYPSLLLDAVKPPDSLLRSMPLNVPHPVHYRHTTTLLLPHDWNIKDSEETIQDEAFVFQRRIAYRNKTLTIDYDYRSLRDSIDAQQTGRYAANIGRVREMLGYEIYQPNAALSSEPKGKAVTKGNDMNWPILAMLLMATFIWVIVAWLVYRYDPPYTPKRLIDPKLAGIRGWLILPAIGLTLTPLRVLLEQRDMLHVFSAQNWSQIIGADGASPFLGLMIIVELIFNSGLIVIGIALAILFFQKRHTLPRLYVVYAVTAGVFIVSDFLMAPLVLSKPLSVTDKAEALKSVIGVIIWVWYFLVSKRVHATFTKSALAHSRTPEFVPSMNLIDGAPQPPLGTDPKI